MTGYIPKNWTLRPSAPCGHYVEATDAAGKQTILAHTYCHVDSHDMDERVAHLIAAAPELLDALKEWTELWRRIYTNEYGSDEEACEHLKDVHALIAKAEGRAP